ncbi:MAG: A/G-specific adenine glycosylase [Oscillibacter sp.]
MENSLAALSAPLLAWYRASARALPWRQTRDPYRIWVSEIMLQQTRVAAVLGYYARFLAAFPSVEALAAAPEDALMKQWEGLGYYSRARNLQAAAKRIVAAGGVFPGDYEGLLALPGIGDYTAGAIASAAFGLRVPAVDGNVLRVMTRLTDCHDNIGDPAAKRAIRAAVAAILPEQPADLRQFNQALMELGAVICGPGGPPKCEICPVKTLCLGHARKTAENLPVKTAKKTRKMQEKTIFLLEKGGKIALRKRSDSGLLASLWEFPNVEGALDEENAPAAVAAWGLHAKCWRKKLTAKHIFTHVEWHMTGYSLEVSGAGPADFLWVDAAGLSRCAVPSAFAKYYAEAQTLLAAETAPAQGETT